MNDMYSSLLCAGTELKPGRHYKLHQALDQAQEGRELAKVAEHPEPACVSPNQDPSVLFPPRVCQVSTWHLPGAVSPTLAGCPATGLSCLSCFGREAACCPGADGRAAARQLVQGNAPLWGTLAPGSYTCSFWFYSSYL